MYPAGAQCKPQPKCLDAFVSGHADECGVTQEDGGHHERIPDVDHAQHDLSCHATQPSGTGGARAPTSLKNRPTEMKRSESDGDWLRKYSACSCGSARS